MNLRNHPRRLFAYRLRPIHRHRVGTGEALFISFRASRGMKLRPSDELLAAAASVEQVTSVELASSLQGTRCAPGHFAP